MSKCEETSITIDDNAEHNGVKKALISVSPNNPEATVYKLSDDEKVNEMKVNDDKF
ncbi:1544_t:CDS:2, partial [Funneliformis geosporum]